MENVNVNAMFDHEQAKDIDFIVVLRKNGLDGHIAANIMREYLVGDKQDLGWLLHNLLTDDEKTKLIDDLEVYMNACQVRFNRLIEDDDAKFLSNLIHRVIGGTIE